MKTTKHPYLIVLLTLMWPILVSVFFIVLIIFAVNETGEKLKHNGGLKHMLEELWYGEPTPNR